MSGGGEHLKEEVDCSRPCKTRRMADNVRQGSRLQVVTAGAIAGLVSRQVHRLKLIVCC